MKEDLKNIIESLLFVAEDPLTIDRIKNVVDIADAAEIKTALATLQADYETRGGGFYLSEVAGGFQIRTRPAYMDWIKRLIKPNPLRLSKAALETLAIIAYKQPLIRSDVEHIRGVDCGGVLRMLLERKLVRVLGRKEIPGRPLIYATTKHFLEVFELKNLKELPTPKEIEELAEEAPADFTDTGENAGEYTDQIEPEDSMEPGEVHAADDIANGDGKNTDPTDRNLSETAPPENGADNHTDSPDADETAVAEAGDNRAPDTLASPETTGNSDTADQTADTAEPPDGGRPNGDTAAGNGPAEKRLDLDNDSPV